MFHNIFIFYFQQDIISIISLVSLLIALATLCMVWFYNHKTYRMSQYIFLQKELNNRCDFFLAYKNRLFLHIDNNDKDEKFYGGEVVKYYLDEIENKSKDNKPTEKIINDTIDIRKI